MLRIDIDTNAEAPSLDVMIDGMCIPGAEAVEVVAEDVDGGLRYVLTGVAKAVNFRDS